MEGLTFSCPVCGADVPRKAKSCPECGACEKSGWSDDRYLDGVDLPDYVSEDEGPRRSSANGGLSPIWWIAAVLVLLGFLILTLRGH